MAADESRKKIKRFLNAKNINLEEFDIKFDITTLNVILAFIYSKDNKLKTKKALSNFYKLFTNINMERYKDNIDMEGRIWVIKTTLFAVLQDDVDDSYDQLISYCKEHLDYIDAYEPILDMIPTLSITTAGSRKILTKLKDTILYGYTMQFKNLYLEIFDAIDEGDFKSYKAVRDDLYNISNLLLRLNRENSNNISEQTFTLEDGEYELIVEDALNKLKDRNKIFLTGIQRLNTLLAPGYHSKRLYTYLAFPGKGKSTILLKTAIDMKKYNKVIKTRDPDKRPAVLMLTLENDIPETMERLYNMTTGNDDIRNYTPKQLLKMMRDKGGLKITEDDPIDIIIKEYKNRAIDTNDIYGIIEDMGDDGIEVIGVIVDYMKRIRPAEKANDEKGELKNITNELKELAKFYDVPVITAQQLNRAGAAVVDAAIQANKEDVTRLVGRENVAGAWEIIENSDVVIIVNPDVKRDTGELYMSFNMIKRRYRSTDSDDKMRRLVYFNQPFEPGSEIKLVDDFYLQSPVSVESLGTQFLPENANRNAMQRENKKKKKEEGMLSVEDFEPFDMENYNN